MNRKLDIQLKIIVAFLVIVWMFLPNISGQILFPQKNNVLISYSKKEDKKNKKANQEEELIDETQQVQEPVKADTTEKIQDRRHKIQDTTEKIEDTRHKTQDRSQKSEVRSQKSGDSSLKPEDSIIKGEDVRQKEEEIRQKKEDSRQDRDDRKHKNKEKKGNNKNKIKQSEEIKTEPVSMPEDEDSMSGTVEWKVTLSDDNGNIKLPERYRTWWYIRLDGVGNNRTSTLYIEGDGFQGGSVVVPVYSYDNKYWHRMRPEDIERGEEKGGLYNYAIKKKFDSSTVWIARYYPYPLSRLKSLLKKYEKNPYAKIEIIGETAHGRPIPMITITDFSVNDKNKKRVWVHARTHPSETSSSFVIEGLIETLLSDCNIHCRKADLSKLIFHIVPMLNIDGVVEGNSRVTPETSYDLERMWHRKPNNPYLLLDSVPPEIKAIHSAITKFDTEGPKFMAAINLHGKNAFPSSSPFIYTNFRKENKEYGSSGDSLFFKQLNFIKILSDIYCGDTLHVTPGFEIAQPMDEKLFPESWWWINFRDSVMAATLETTTGYNGCFEEWVTYQDHLKLGEALAETFQKYYNYFVAFKWFRYEAPEADINKLMKFYKVNGN